MLAREAERTSRRWWSAWLDVKLAQAHHHYWMNNQNALARTAEQLQTDLQTHGTPAQRTDCLSVLLKETYRRQRYVLTEDSDDLADTFYRASVEIGDRYAEFQRGFHLLWRGKLNDALSHLEAGRDIARDIGDPVMEDPLPHLRRDRAPETGRPQGCAGPPRRARKSPRPARLRRALGRQLCLDGVAPGRTRRSHPAGRRGARRLAPHRSFTADRFPMDGAVPIARRRPRPRTHRERIRACELAGGPLPAATSHRPRSTRAKGAGAS